jgi:hypothetical protein
VQEVGSGRTMPVERQTATGEHGRRAKKNDRQSSHYRVGRDGGEREHAPRALLVRLAEQAVLAEEVAAERERRSNTASNMQKSGKRSTRACDGDGRGR